MQHLDHGQYWKFTGPYRLAKSLQTLDGILAGVTADGVVNAAELGALRRWLDDHADHKNKHPFNEVYRSLAIAISDGHLDDEEVADVRWLCQQMDPEKGYCDGITEDMRTLQGLLGGIIADGVVSTEELSSLQDWMDQHENLKTCWPFDEIEALVLAVMKDGKIDAGEQNLLLHYFNQWSTIHGNRAVDLPLNEVGTPIGGLCAVCPEIAFAEKTFCFTGASTKFTRKEFAELVANHGGRFWPRVATHVDYLVIGGDGNPCWAFACYGRKVEQAVEMRRNGHRLLLVHEVDFLDALN